MGRKGYKYKKYSAELKTTAVQEYLNGGGSHRYICKKYEISSTSVFRKWIKWYNGHKEFKERNSTKGEIYMTKGIKTTLEERANIVTRSNPCQSYILRE
ncbi:MAG: transposase [Clostridia bacterium]|nr:transposase [Clostridia bacterium]